MLLDGRGAWRVVAAAFVAMALVFGIGFSSGSLLDAMAEALGAGGGAIALPFALASALPFVLAPLTGRAVDRYGPRRLLLASGVAGACGLALAAAAPVFALAAAAYGVGIGVAGACVLTPMMSTVGRWFEERRAVAIGAAGCGASAGTLLLAPAVAGLVHAHGHVTACLVLAAALALVLPVCAAFTARPPAIAGAGPVAAGMRELLRRPEFRRCYATALIASAGPYVPFAFLASGAIDDGVAPVTAGILVSVMGAAGAAGRLLGPVLGQRAGLRRVLRIGLIAHGLALLAWPACGGSVAALAIFATAFGFAYGASASLFNAVVAAEVGPTELARGLGVLYTGVAAGVLVGPLLAGGLIAATGDHVAAALVIGSICLAGAAMSPAPERRPQRAPAVAVA